MLRSVTAGDKDKRKQQCRMQTGRSFTTAVVSSQSEPSAYSCFFRITERHTRIAWEFPWDSPVGRLWKELQHDKDGGDGGYVGEETWELTNMIRSKS